MEQKTQVPSNQIVSLVTVFLIGTITIISPANEMGKYSYISVLLAFLIYLVVLGLYYLLSSLEPDKNLFAIHDAAYGRIIGTIVNLFYLVYFFAVTTLIVANFINFINTAILVRTPDLVIASLIVLSIVYSARARLRAILKFSELSFVLTIVTIVGVTLMVAELMDPRNLLPVIPSDWSAVVDSSFTVFSFPFGEMVIVLSVAGLLGKPRQVFKSFTKGSFLALALILTVVLRNVLVLGEFTSMTSYPSFETARLINISQVLTRTEVFVALNFVFSGLLKGFVSFYSLARGIKETFKLKTCKHLILPLGALVALSAHLSFPSILQNVYFAAEFYRYYAFIPQVVLILITFVVLYIRKKVQAK
ncbi:MAG TPA: endospore germination permease [Bacillota bacterium]|nr:endospore germination permease [Bacillota bacterium]